MYVYRETTADWKISNQWPAMMLQKEGLFPFCDFSSRNSVMISFYLFPFILITSAYTSNTSNLAHCSYVHFTAQMNMSQTKSLNLERRFNFNLGYMNNFMQWDTKKSVFQKRALSSTKQWSTSRGIKIISWKFKHLCLDLCLINAWLAQPCQFCCSKSKNNSRF